jgi:methylglutaconyl-CoA hydratase
MFPMANYENILFEVQSGAARITLNRPAKRNALNPAMIDEIIGVLAECANNEVVRVVSITGAGDDFCSGADLKALESTVEAGVLSLIDDARGTAELFLRMRQHPRPIVAAVRGRALAGGCGLATAADLVLAAESARFGYPEVNVGFIPAMVTAMLRRTVGEKNVFELIATGEIIAASRARELGLVNRVFPDNDFQREVESYVAALAAKPVSALTLAKKLIYHTDAMNFETAIEAGVYLNVLARKTDDFERGVKRFLAKGTRQEKADKAGE